MRQKPGNHENMDAGVVAWKRLLGTFCGTHLRRVHIGRRITSQLLDTSQQAILDLLRESCDLRAPKMAEAIGVEDETCVPLDSAGAISDPVPVPRKRYQHCQMRKTRRVEVRRNFRTARPVQLSQIVPSNRSDVIEFVRDPPRGRWSSILLHQLQGFRDLRIALSCRAPASTARTAELAVLGFFTSTAKRILPFDMMKSGFVLPFRSYAMT